MTELLDNDILLKGACYGFLHDLMAVNCQSLPVGYLAVARYVLDKKLKKIKLRGESLQVAARLKKFFSEHESIEPTPEEAAFASELESSAQALAVPLDTGESQLLAILVARGTSGLFTGDKRAIVATEQLLDSVSALATVVGKMKSIEQLVKRLLEGKDLDETRALVCSEPDVDRTLTICFQCSSSCIELADVLTALESYINDLRKLSQRVLAT